MLKIWGRPTSICTQRALWACVEAGVEFELILASATMGPQGHVSTGARPFGCVDEPWYRAMNPNGTVPTLDDDGFRLWESNAIVSYLALKYAPEKLFDGRPETFALATQWMSWTNERLEPPLHTLVMELERLREELRTPGAAQQAAHRLAPQLSILDAHLSRHPYVAGESFSMGDIPVAAAVHRWKVFGLEGPATPGVDRWLDDIAPREGFRRHVQPRELHV